MNKNNASTSTTTSKAKRRPIIKNPKLFETNPFRLADEPEYKHLNKLCKELNLKL